ncbi:hypothetical protein RCL1_000762 [Eukaryota sp. TZLM3-RCL]
MVVTNVLNHVRTVLQNLLNDISGMKALLLDTFTTSIVTHIFSHSEIVNEQVFLVRKLSSPCSEPLHHLKCVVFLSPEPDSIKALATELKEAKFCEYFIIFTSAVSDDVIRDVAAADTSSLVQWVRTYYLNFITPTPIFSHGNLPISSLATTDIHRITNFVSSYLYTVGCIPSIRYLKGNELSRSLAISLHSTCRQNRDLVQSNPLNRAQLIIFDRREDPISPVILPWTYHAMVSELLGITNNRVSLNQNSQRNSSEKEFVLSPNSDTFFATNRNLSYADVAVATQEAVAKFAREQNDVRQVQSLSEVQNFVENYPEFRNKKSTVAKHVAIVSELVKIVENRRLMDVCELEQCFVSSSTRDSAQISKMIDFIRDETINLYDRLRLLLILIVKYDDIPLSMIVDVDTNHREIFEKAYHKIKNYTSNRILDLFRNRTLFSKAQNVVKKQIKSVNNVYSQHEPFILSLIDSVRNKTLRESTWPFVDDSSSRDRPSLLILFVMGGVSLMEAQIVEEWNSKDTSMKVLLLGSNVCDHVTFLDSIIEPEGGGNLASSAINRIVSLFQ